MKILLINNCTIHIKQNLPLIGTIVLGVILATLTGCGTNNQQEKAISPNIIYILLDELGYYELSCYGSKKLSTPNIDRIASEGILFTNAYAGAPVCAPTRSCLLTGTHMGHTTVRINAGYEPIRDEDVTIAERLKSAGYITGGFGKWGIGGRGTSGIPEKQGFDLFFGYYDQRHAHSYFPPYLIRNGKEIELPGNTKSCYYGETFAQYEIFNETIKFIKQNHDKPFFCYCPWTPPHGLWGIPEDDKDWQKYKNKPWKAGQQTPRDARVYAAFVSMIDRQIGEIVTLLKQLNIDDNTLIFISGDNGGQAYFNDEENPYGFFGPNLNAQTGKIFRGEKGSLYEGGLKIPMIARWKGHIAPGQVSDLLWYFPDIMPTFTGLAGIQAPDSCDGISILPTLLGEKYKRKQETHTYLYWEYEGQVAVRKGKWKAIKTKKDNSFELYNLTKDIEEKEDLSGLHPEVLDSLIQIAKEAHKPVIRGIVNDKDLAEKDHNLVDHSTPPGSKWW